MDTRLRAGDPAPDLVLPATSGGNVSLADFEGRGVIVYFFPKAMTPGCTTEACDFRDNLLAFESANYAVVGVSPDSLETLHEFTAKQGLPFTLASDTDLSTADRWGAVGEKLKGGESVRGVIRSTIVVSPDGTVELAQYGVDAEGHVDELRAALEVPAGG